MKFKLRDHVNVMPFWGTMILIFLCVAFAVFCANNLSHAQEKQDPPAKAEEAVPVKTWKLPAYMQGTLQRELDDFNKRFEEKVQAYKKELKTRFAEFKDMPDDAILYLEGCIFITRSDFKKLQDQLRDKLKKEVKGDDKTTN